MIVGSSLQEDIRVLTVYAPNSHVSEYMKQKLIELLVEISESTS